MAQLRNTTPGQLSKYTSSLLQLITDSMKKKKSVPAKGKSFVFKDTDNNRKTLDEYVKLLSLKDEKKALSLILETTDGLEITIGSLDKPTSIGNRGDIAEGIIGAAIFARFLNKKEKINKKHVYDVLKNIKRNIKTKKGKKGKESYIKTESDNLNPLIKDDISFYLSLADINMTTVVDNTKYNILDDLFDSAINYANSNVVMKWADLLYDNNKKDFIEVISDGLGNQKGTKVDVRVKINNAFVDINVSLKAGDVKQFGQVGGTSFDKMKSLFKTTFNIDIDNFEKKYTNILKNDEIGALNFMYKQISEIINGMLINDISKKKFLKDLGKGINHHATLGEENVTLVQLDKRIAKIYKFDQLDSLLKNIKIKSVIVQDSSKKPTLKLVTKDNNKELLQIRVKHETSKNYIRNYIEKGKYLGELIAEKAS